MRYKICSNCGAQTDENRVICPNCGTNLEDVEIIEDVTRDIRMQENEVAQETTVVFNPVSIQGEYTQSEIQSGADDVPLPSNEKKKQNDKKTLYAIMGIVVAILVVVAIIIALLLSGNSADDADTPSDSSSSAASVSESAIVSSTNPVTEKTTAKNAVTEETTTAQPVTYTFRIQLPECIDADGKHIEDVVTVYVNDKVAKEEEVFLNGEIIKISLNGDANTKCTVDIEINNTNDYKKFVFYGRKDETKTVDFSSSSFNDSVPNDYENGNNGNNYNKNEFKPENNNENNYNQKQ